MTAFFEMNPASNLNAIGERLRDRVFLDHRRGHDGSLGGFHHFDMCPGFMPVARVSELGRFIETCLLGEGDPDLEVALFSDGCIDVGYACDGDVMLTIILNAARTNPHDDQIGASEGGASRAPLILLNTDAKKRRWSIVLPPRYVDPLRLFEAPLTAHERLQKATHPRDGAVNACMLAAHEILALQAFERQKIRAMKLVDRVARILAMESDPRAALQRLIDAEIAELARRPSSATPRDEAGLAAARDLFALARDLSATG